MNYGVNWRRHQARFIHLEEVWLWLLLLVYCLGATFENIRGSVLLGGARALSLDVKTAQVKCSKNTYSGDGFQLTLSFVIRQTL